MKTSLPSPTALCNLLCEKWNCTFSAILINWENTVLFLWRSAKSLHSGHFYRETQGMDDEWENLNSEMSSDTPEMYYRWIRTSQAEMPWLCVVLEGNRNIQKKTLGSTFCNRNPKAARETLFVSVSTAFPAPAAPFILAGGKKSLEYALPCSKFHLYQSFLHVLAQKYATWPKYSNQSALCQTVPLGEGSQAGLLFGYSLPLFCIKTISLSKAHFFFMISKIAFMGGVTACKGRSGGKPLSILHL